MSRNFSRWVIADEQELPPARGVLWVVLALAGVFVLLIVLLVVSQLLPKHPVDETFESGPPVAMATDGYVGSSACRECHPQEYSTWHDSYHRTMTQVASHDSIVGDFNDVRLQRFGIGYRLERGANDFWVEVTGRHPDATVPDVQPDRQKIVLCTGSHHMQVYWLSTGRGRELAVLPFVWLIREQRWIPRESAFLELPSAADVYEAGRWNRSCITCHTTHGNRNVNPPAPPQSTVAEFGIACEACHGPGDVHVRYHSHEGSDHAAADSEMTHPARLGHERAAEICGQCHMAWHSEVPDSGLSFRPGDDLRSLRRVNKKPSQFWPDGMVRVVGREFNGLMESPCFQRGEMSCLTCHQLHQSKEDTRSRSDWTDDQLKLGMRTNEACLSCHEVYRSESTLVAHTHHSPLSAGSVCYNCHMPNTAYGLLKATRVHQISSPTVEETLLAGRPNACNLCHMDETLQWMGDKLVRWYGHAPARPAEELSPLAESVRMALVGDAGQRALIAWHLGWEPAREASGENWQIPFLALLLTDDYPAVRFIAHRSLMQIGGYSDISYDSEMPAAQRSQAARAIIERWQSEPAVFDKPNLMINAKGELDQPGMSQLLKQRDQTVISLAE